MPEAPTSAAKQDENEGQLLSDTDQERSQSLVEDLPSEFKVFGYEMLDREVKKSGNSGRVYLPKDWIGTRVRIIRASRLIEKGDE
ncbi:MAG: DUF2080 family transposase-associated protein [Candidatus Heimdallarchaeota archaeon]